nr:TonB-dependent receptor plug domain-containing protein [Cytophagales bacterium]
MKNSLLIAILIIFWPLMVQGQGTVSLQGSVSSESGERIPFATLKWSGIDSGTTTDIQGKFTLTSLPEGKILLVSAVGYESLEIQKEELTHGRSEFFLKIKEEELQPVTVSAQKRDEVLQYVPAPISVIDRRGIEKGELRVLSDLPALAPNLNIVDAGAPIAQIPSIRGFNSFGGEPAVGVYVDGVVQLDGNFLNEQLINVERIEVLRGPQGTLYGRNALGGVINIITRQPTNTFHGEAFVGVGNFGHQRHGLSLNMPLLKNKLYLRTSGMFERRNGFFNNAFDGEIYDGFRRYSGSAALQWNIDEKWKAIFTFNHNVDDHDGIYPYHTSIDALRQNGFTINLNEQQALKRKISRSSLTLNRAGQNTEFTSISSIAFSDSDLQGTRWEGDFSALDFLSFEMTDDGFNSRVAMQEFRLSSHPSSSKLKWIVGTNGFFQNKNESIITVYGRDVPPPQSQGDPIPGSRFINKVSNRNYGLAGFGEIEWSATEKWKVTGGLRYDYEYREATTSFDFELPPNPPVNVQPESTVNANFQALTPKLTLMHQVNELVNLYAVFARGFRAGGMNVYNEDPEFRTFDPEFSNNYELGFKSNLLKNRMKVNANVFLINWNDKQVNTLVPNQGGGFQQAILNTGLLDASGLEVEMSFIPMKGLKLDYNFGYTRAIFRDLPISEGQNLQGNFQPFQPRFTSMAIAQYDFKLKKDLSAFIRGEWRTMGKQYFDFENNSFQDTYSLFNARAGLSYKGINFDLWVRNVANTEYIQFGYAFLGFENYMLGAPRTFGSTLSVNF